MSDKLILQLDRSVFDKILSYGIDIRKYVLGPIYNENNISDTDLILSNKIDREELLSSINDIENGNNLVKVNLEDL